MAKPKNLPLNFEREYWEKNYSEPESMDCIGNAREHAAYLKYLFKLDLVDVSSVIDFGVGLGYLFREILKTFLPADAVAMDPSKYVLARARRRLIPPVASMNMKVLNIDVTTWAKRLAKKGPVYDLGVCTSVFQYISEEDLKLVIPMMAAKVKYLYFTVPTDKEMKRMDAEVKFFDPYALARSREFYLELLRPHFTVVSRRLLESKRHFSERDTLFSELLFRF